MRYFFIDTNVILDLLADRKPYSENTLQLFNFAEQKKVRLYCSAISYNNIYYILRKEIGHAKSIQILNDLKHELSVIDLEKNTLFKAMDSDFKDFEDAIQYFSALTNSNIECIVTRNEKDFKQSVLPVLTTDLAVFDLLNE